MKTTFKMIVALSALALGFVSSNAYAQAGAAGAAGAGRRGAAGAGRGAAGAGFGGGGGFNAPIPTIDALTTALMLTPDEVKVITPILADMTKAQTDFTAAQMAYTTGRTAAIAKISDALTDTQKPLVAAQFGGGRRGGAAGQGRRGGANGAPPGAPPPAAATPAPGA